MKCAFYRPEEINVEEFNNIVNGLKKDLAAMESGRVTKEETIQYLRELLPQARFLDHTPDMCFFGLDEPQHMPSDARVEYFYKPTYLAAAMLMHACVTYPSILVLTPMPCGKHLRLVMKRAEAQNDQIAHSA